MASDLSLKILGDCDQGVISEFKFYSGEDRTIKLQVYDTVNNQRWCIPDDAVLTLYFPSTTGTDISIADANITVSGDCSATISADLTAAQTTTMMTGWIKLKIVDPDPAPAITTKTRWAIKEFGTKKLSDHN